jgi:hypothetical protein
MHARARTHSMRRAGPARDHRHWATRSRKDDDTSTHSSEQAELTRRSCRQVQTRAGVCIDHGHSWFHSRGGNKMRVVEIPSVFAFAHNEGPAVPKHPASQEETCAGGCMIELISTHFHSRRGKKLRVVEIPSPIALADNQGSAVHKHPASQEETQSKTCALARSQTHPHTHAQRSNHNYTCAPRSACKLDKLTGVSLACMLVRTCTHVSSQSTTSQRLTSTASSFPLTVVTLV